MTPPRVSKSSVITPPSASKGVAPRTPHVPKPSVDAPLREPDSLAPRSLADIATSEEEDEGDGEGSDGWDADSEHEDRGPLLNPTGHPDYVPQAGQQPYMRNGRRYWF